MPTDFAKALVEDKEGDKALLRAVGLSKATYLAKVASLVELGRETCKTGEQKATKNKDPPPDDILITDYKEGDEFPYTYKCKDKDIVRFNKLTLTTPWSSAPWSSKELPWYNTTDALDEMEAPFRVLYSFDKYNSTTKTGVIEIAFRGTVILGKGSLGKRIEGCETAVFDAVFLKMPLGGGSAPFGVRRVFRCQENVKSCPGPCHYCVAGCCILPFDVCTAVYPIPAFCAMSCFSGVCKPITCGIFACGAAVAAAAVACINPDDTHGFAEWHQSGMMAEHGIDGVQASVATGFLSAAGSTIPSVEAMLNKEFGIEEDKTAKWLKMICCAPQTGWATACSFFTGFCCWCVPGACQFCNTCPAACCRPFDRCWDDCENKVMERRGGKYLVKPEQVCDGGFKQQGKGVTIRLTGHSLGGAIATIGAMKLAHKGWDVELITFGSPRVGNASFASLTKKLVKKNARFKNPGDLAPNLPPELAKFSHVDEVYTIDKESCVHNTLLPGAAHELANYEDNLYKLHQVKGVHEGPSNQEMSRDETRPKATAKVAPA